MKSIICTLLLSLIISISFAQAPCALDPSFDTDGMITTNNGRQGNVVVLQPDGKVIVGCEPQSSGSLQIIRYNVDGSVDQTFGTNGVCTIQIGTVATRVKDMQLYNGVLYIAGTTTTVSNGTTTYVYFAAVNSTGNMVSTFGTNGVKKYSSSPRLYIVNAMEIDDNGVAYAAGTKGSNNYYALKFDVTTGNPITSFGVNGIKDFASQVSNLLYRIEDIALDNNDKILIGGSRYYYYNTGPLEQYKQLIRLNSTDGSFDNTFGNNGLATYFTDSTYYHFASRVHVTQNNDYILAGYTYDKVDYDYTVVKVKNNGTIDPSFGTNGWAVHDFYGQNVTEAAYNGALMPDEKILLTGNHGSGDTVHFSLMMLNPDGSRDLTFGPNGVFKNIFNQNNNSSSRGMAVDPAGKIVLAGYTRTCANGTCGPLRMAVSRYTFGIGSSVGVNDFTTHNELVISPNPSQGQFTIEMESKIEEVEVFDLQGRKVPISWDHNQVQIIDYAKGIYILRVSLKERDLISKIVLE